MSNEARNILNVDNLLVANSDENLGTRNPSDIENLIRTESLKVKASYFKIARANHHLQLVTQFKTRNHIPKGLTPKIKVVAFAATQELKDNVERIQRECGLNLLNTLIEHYENIIEESQQDINISDVNITQKIDSDHNGDPTTSCANGKMLASSITKMERKRPNLSLSNENGPGHQPIQTMKVMKRKLNSPSHFK